MCRSTNSLIFCWVSPPIGPSSGTAVLCWTRFRVFTRIVSMVILPSSSGYSPFSLPGRLTCGEFQESSRVFPTHHSLGVLDTRIPYLLFLSFFFLREDYGVPGRLLDFPCLLARPLDRRIVALPFFFLELTSREMAFALLWQKFLGHLSSLVDLVPYCRSLMRPLHLLPSFCYPDFGSSFSAGSVDSRDRTLFGSSLDGKYFSCPHFRLFHYRWTLLSRSGVRFCPLIALRVISRGAFSSASTH